MKNIAMQNKNIKQIHRIYIYIYIIKYIIKLQTLNSALSTINSFAYTYDSVGNKLTKQDSAGTHNYTYDNTYQLIQSTLPNETFTYDPAGNRLTGPTTNDTYTHNANNQITQSCIVDPASCIVYTYDNNGNRYIKTQTDGTVVYYSYDYEGRLTRVETQKPTGTTIAIYKYDPLGRRIEKAVTENSITTTTRYLYDGFNIVAEYDENNNVKAQYIHNLGIDDQLAMVKNGNTYYYHKDGLGSVVALTDNTGSIVQKYEYDSFGNITSTLNPNFIQPYTFTGREYNSETGMYFYRERSYDQKTGTFISKDPIGFEAGDVNLYRYVGNNPINFVDPLGLFGIFGPGLTNVRWPHEPCRSENDPEDPYVKSLMAPYLKGDKVPGQFGTLGIVIVYGIGSSVYRQGIWTARTITYGTPFMITVDPNLYIMTPEKAEYYKSQKKKK